MEWEEYQAMLQEMNSNDTTPDRRSELFTNLTTGYRSQLDSISQLNTDNERIKTENQQYSLANTRLTLALGETMSPPEAVQRQEQEKQNQNIRLSDILERKI